MATVTRQPFAPLDGARLQSLTSMKNRQNAISPVSSSVKRKASESLEIDDFENVDPVMFSKRSKGTDSFFSGKDSPKPSSFVLTKATSAPSLSNAASLSNLSPVKATSPRVRALLQPKSPAAKLNTSIARSPLSAPAGRSPTRGSKRVGLLSNRRRTAGSNFSRVDPPSFNLGAAAPFSLDAALKGTIPSYSSSRPSALSLEDTTSTPSAGDLKSSWFFDIHEDTPEQEMTNLLQHSTCVLDISSDEESEQRARRERAEGRDKENIPPADDISQTSSRRAARDAPFGIDDMMVEKSRDPLSQLNAADFYAAGCDEASVIIVQEDDEDAETVVEEDINVPAEEQPGLAASDFAFAPEIKLESVIDVMMGKDEPAAKAAVLEPIEGTGESFDLWESGSAQDDAEPVAAPSPSPVVNEPETFMVAAECR